MNTDDTDLQSLKMVLLHFLIRVNQWLSVSSVVRFLLFCFDYGARKYPEISMTTCVGFDPKILIDPFAAGTIARLEVIAPSPAFRVETNGLTAPCGHSVKKPRGPGGTTVAFSTYACAAAGAPQDAAATFRSIFPLNGCEPAGFRVSSTR